METVPRGGALPLVLAFSVLAALIWSDQPGHRSGTAPAVRGGRAHPPSGRLVVLVVDSLRQQTLDEPDTMPYLRELARPRRRCRAGSAGAGSPARRATGGSRRGQ